MQVSGSLRLCHDGDQDAGTCHYFLSFLPKWQYIYDTNSCISMTRYLQSTQLKWYGARRAREVEYRYNFWDNQITHTQLKSFAYYCLHCTSNPTLRCSAAGIVLSMSIWPWVLLVEMTVDSHLPGFPSCLYHWPALCLEQASYHFETPFPSF